MKVRNIFLVVLAVLLCIGLADKSRIKAESKAAVKVAIMPLKALGEDDTTGKLAKDLLKSLLKKAKKLNDLDIVEIDEISAAPKDVLFVIYAEVSLQGESAMVAVKLLDHTADGKVITGRIVPGAPDNPDDLATGILDIIRKQAALSAPPAAPEPPEPVAPAATPSLADTQPARAPVATAAPKPKKTPPPVSKPRRVKSWGAAVMPIQRGRVSLAQKGAYALAKRDLIERALGAMVDLVAAPDQQRREILSKLQGKVENVTVVTDKREGNMYVVQLEGYVVVPAALAKEFPPLPKPESTGMPPAVQPFPKGKVNWGEGYLEATGTGKLTDDQPNAVEMAKRAARVDAYAVALEMIKGINYDPDLAISDILSRQRIMEYRVRGLVQGAQTLKTEKADGAYKVTVRVPLWGLKGVTVVFKNLYSKFPAPPPEEEQPPEDGEDEGEEEGPSGKPATGLVVDARGTGLTPALFPAIVDEDGKVVYGAGMVVAEELSRRGVAAYATSTAKGARLGPDPLRIRALGMNRNEGVQVTALGSGAWKALFGSKILPAAPWILAQATAKVTLRQGGNPTKVRSVKAEGKRKAKVVISNKDALLVRKSTKKSNYLVKARVVIIVDSMVGATEGRRIQPGGTLAALRRLF